MAKYDDMKFSLTTSKTSEILKSRTSVLVVPVFQQVEGTAQKKAKKTALSETATRLNTALNGAIVDTLTTTEFTGALGQTFWLPGVSADTGKAASAAAKKHPRVLLVGMGVEQKWSLESARRMAALALLAVKTLKPEKVSVVADDCFSDELFADDIAQAITEGFELGAYRFFKYKKEEKKQWESSMPKQVEILLGDAAESLIDECERGMELAQLTTAGTILARDLINEPAIHVTPRSLSEAARAIAKSHPQVSVKIMGEKEMKKLGMGSLLAVAAGSDEEAQFIHLVYKPKRANKNTKRVVLCGKGITFDSGGLSLKPGDYMHGMKMDMSGAAAVLGLFSQLGKLAPNVEVHGVIPATENMPSGRAARPGDVAVAYDGTTIEITNTDAEGRLILADAIAWSVKNLKPDYLVDLATLTGAVIVALGQEVAAYYTNNDELKELVDVASAQAGEPMWHMPLVDEYRPIIKSPIADLDNSPMTRWAGSVIGALFLEHFAKETPWMHIDIAGPAIVEKQMLPYVPVGGSGFAVRTLIEMMKGLEAVEKE